MEQLQLRTNHERLLDDFQALAQIGATVDGGISRLALSNEDLQARAWLAQNFEQAGLRVYDDDAGNLSGILPSGNPDARTLLLGSHLDSVPNGGRYDSSVGVLAALESVRTLKENQVQLPFHLEAINFTDEEGCWQSLFGSRALTGHLKHINGGGENTDQGAFRAALFRAGIRPTDIYRAHRDSESVIGYLELHIEQGNQLDRSGYDIGVVTSIVGRTTYHITFYGQASHSGTTPMTDRRDALHAATDFLSHAYHYVGESFPGGVFNCGNMQVAPGAFNIIPAEVRLTLEVRHGTANTLAQMETDLTNLARQHAEEHQIQVNIVRLAHLPAVMMAPRSVEAIEKASKCLNVNSMRIISYAGHDAQILSTFTPTGMIFIPSVNGISHSPQEFTEWRHVALGADTMLHTILQLAHDTR